MTPGGEEATGSLEEPLWGVRGTRELNHPLLFPPSSTAELNLMTVSTMGLLTNGVFFLRVWVIGSAAGRVFGVESGGSGPRWLTCEKKISWKFRVDLRGY